MTEQPQETVSVEFSVRIGDRKFTATADVPAGQTNLTQILPVIQSLDDSLVAGVATILAEAGRKISCKAGCGACCRQMVPISIFEAESLTAWIRTLPEARQQELAARFHQALLKLAAAGLVDRMVKEDWLAETESARLLATDYFYQRVPCPFLENESCSIHPIRPLVCREYLVSSSPEHCADPLTLQIIPVRLPISFGRVLNFVGAELEQSVRCWIPLLFLFAWMKGDAHPGDRVAGTGPHVIHEFLKRIDLAQPPSPAVEDSAYGQAREPS
jgi:Fe-S-cluster containining protein